MRTALFLTDSGDMGGGQRVLLDLLERLDRSRVRPILATLEGGALVDRTRVSGVETWIVPRGRKLAGLSRRAAWWNALALTPDAIAIVAWLRRRIHAERVDVVVTGSTECHVMGGLAGRAAGARVIARVHDIVDRPGFGAPALLADELTFGLVAQRVLPVSEAAARSVRSLGVARGKIRVIYNGIAADPRPSAAERAATRERLGVPRSAFVVASVGRLVRWKGQHLLLDALPWLVSRYPMLRILFVGEAHFDRDGYRAELERRIKASGFAEHCSLLGHRDDVREILAASDLLVHTSILPDPLPTVLLEAIAAGTYIVGADAGGVPEIVTGPGIGRLYRHGDVGALLDAIAPGIQDAAAAASALERFAMSRYVDAMTSELE